MSVHLVVLEYADRIRKIAWFGYASFFAFGVAWYYKPNTR